MGEVAVLVGVAIVAVVVFDFTNGFHDASNMIATLVASRAMTPAPAVGLVGVFTFLGPLLGGWGIVRTVGFGIYRLRPLHGFDAQLASASVIFGASLIGGPVSTTHVVSTSIMGIGASERPRAVRWTKAREIGMTWVLTLPGAAALGAGAYALFAGVRGLSG